MPGGEPAQGLSGRESTRSGVSHAGITACASGRKARTSAARFTELTDLLYSLQSQRFAVLVRFALVRSAAKRWGYPGHLQGKALTVTGGTETRSAQFGFYRLFGLGERTNASVLMVFKALL